MVDNGILIDTDDLGVAEQQLSDSFGAIHIRSSGDQPSTRTRIWRSYVGSLSVDDAELNYEMSFDMEPTDGLLLCRVRSGVLEETQHRQPARAHTTGDVVVYGGEEGRPFAGRVFHAHYHLLTIPRRALAEAAGLDGPETLSLQSSRPVTAAANQHLVDVVDHIRHGVLANTSAATEPLVGGAVMQYLAASVLASFPLGRTGETVRPTGDDDNPEALRRATAFVDDEAWRDITVCDIARAARVSVESVHSMFRRHHRSTPTDYLRQVRLRRAHEALVAADPSGTSAEDVAHRWGFWRVDLFREFYARTYGCAPESTLRS